jgi:hypothetical protein
MNRFLLKFTASALALALGLAPAWAGVAAQVSPPALPGQSYVVIDLTPVGSATSSAAGASGVQQVGSAGFAAAAGQPVVNHAMLWNGSAADAIDLGTGTAAAVGDSQQVGSANNHAALWLGTAASRIDLNPAQWEQSAAAGVAGGRQAGWAGTAKLVVNPPAPKASDTVAIQRAEYVSSKRQLSVQATSSNPSATLTVFVAATGQAIGVLANRGGGRYDGTFSVATNPQTVVVKSSLGGSASRAVTLK